MIWVSDAIHVEKSPVVWVYNATNDRMHPAVWVHKAINNPKHPGTASSEGILANLAVKYQAKHVVWVSDAIYAQNTQWSGYIIS